MIFGLGTKNKSKAPPKKASGYTKSHTITKKTAQSAQSREAAEVLRKMQAKKDSDSCPFC